MRTSVRIDHSWMDINMPSQVFRHDVVNDRLEINATIRTCFCPIQHCANAMIHKHSP